MGKKQVGLGRKKLACDGQNILKLSLDIRAGSGSKLFDGIKMPCMAIQGFFIP